MPYSKTVSIVRSLLLLYIVPCIGVSMMSRLISALHIWALLYVRIITAAVEFTNTNFGDITTGQAFTLAWTGETGAITLTLKTGTSNNLQTVETIGCAYSTTLKDTLIRFSSILSIAGLTGDSFTWNVPKTLPGGEYAIEIEDASSVNYSPEFEIKGSVSSSTLASIIPV